MQRDAFVELVRRAKRDSPHIRSHIRAQSRGIRDKEQAKQARKPLLQAWFADLLQVRDDDGLDAFEILRTSGRPLYGDTWVARLVETAHLVRLKRENGESQARRRDSIAEQCAAGDDVPAEWVRAVARIAGLKESYPAEYARRVGILRKWHGKGKSAALSWQLEQLGELERV